MIKKVSFNDWLFDRKVQQSKKSLQVNSQNSCDVDKRHDRMVNQEENFERMIQGEKVFVDLRHVGRFIR